MPHVGVNLAPGRIDSPFGAGDSSGNHKIGQSAGTNRLVYRLVPQRTATLWDVWIETRARSGPNCSPQLTDADGAETNSYSAGNPNNWLWEVRFHPMKNDGSGWFDPSTNLVPAQQFNPYFQRRNTSFQVEASYIWSALKIPVGVAGLAVTNGTPIAMTIAPVNGAPATDYASANQIYMGNGREGSMARNEVGTNASDVFYGLDSRVMQGGSNASGSSQWYPGNNFNGAPFTKHLPVFVMVYSDQVAHGQPYFSAASGSNPTLVGTQYTMNYKVPSATTFTHLRAVFSNADSFQAILAVNGVDQGTVTLTCASAAPPGAVVTAKLPSSVPVGTGNTITVRFTCNVQNAVIRCYANGLFASCLGHGSSYYASLTGDVQRVVPVMPVPFPFPVLINSTFPVTGAPATPLGFTATGAPSTASLAWTANAESYLDHYNVYRNGTLIGTATTNAYADTTGTNGTSYSYQVSAVALDGRESALCSAQSATPTTPAVIAYVGPNATLVSSAGASTQTITLTSNTTINNTFVVGAAGRNSGATLNSVTDTRGNTWIVDKQVPDATTNNAVAVASAKLTTALLTGDTVVLHWSASLGPSNVAELHEFSGIATSPLDQTGSVASSTTTAAPAVSTTGATLQATELVVAAFSVGGGGATTLTAGTNYTLLGARMATSGATSGDRSLVMVYRILSSAGSQTASININPSGTNDAVVVTLKGA